MEVRLAQLEMLTDQNGPVGRAAIIELRSLSMTVNHQPDMPLGDIGSTSSECSKIKAKIRANDSQIYHYSSKH